MLHHTKFFYLLLKGIIIIKVHIHCEILRFYKTAIMQLKDQQELLELLKVTWLEKIIVFNLNGDDCIFQCGL